MLDLRQKVEDGDEQVGAAEVADHGVHASEVLAPRDGDEHAEHESVAAQRQHEDDRLHADLGVDERLVARRQRRRPRRLSAVGVVVRRRRRRPVPPLHRGFRTHHADPSLKLYGSSAQSGLRFAVSVVRTAPLRAMSFPQKNVARGRSQAVLRTIATTGAAVRGPKRGAAVF